MEKYTLIRSIAFVICSSVVVIAAMVIVGVDFDYLGVVGAVIVIGAACFCALLANRR